MVQSHLESVTVMDEAAHGRDGRRSPTLSHACRSTWAMSSPALTARTRTTRPGAALTAMQAEQRWRRRAVTPTAILSVRCTRLENAPVVLKTKTGPVLDTRIRPEGVRCGVGKLTTLPRDMYRFSCLSSFVQSVWQSS